MFPLGGVESSRLRQKTSRRDRYASSRRAGLSIPSQLDRSTNTSILEIKHDAVYSSLRHLQWKEPSFHVASQVQETVYRLDRIQQKTLRADWLLRYIQAVRAMQHPIQITFDIPADAAVHASSKGDARIMAELDKMDKGHRNMLEIFLHVELRVFLAAVLSDFGTRVVARHDLQILLLACDDDK